MLRIVYFGTSPFAVPPLKALFGAKGRAEVVAVVTKPDKPVGRKGELQSSPVAKAAREAGAMLLMPASLKTEDLQERLAALHADLFVVAAYGKIVPRAVLDLPKLGCLNLHGSLLPKYRGASPIQAAIAAGERETGVSLMRMDEQVDHGPVLATVAVPIDPGDTYGTLEAKLADAAADLLVAHLDDIAEGKLVPEEQPHDAATYTAIIGREDGFVRWDGADAKAVERRLRAFDPWPGLYAVWTRNGRPLRLKLTDVHAIENRPGLEPGTAFIDDEGFPAVSARTGAVRLVQVQPEGKKPMDGKAFLNGYKDFAGAELDLAEPSVPPPASK
ncbi:MAG TPA: methionyl-tRNA formyltransferase [Patescibacteria group bacterium]|nr:methionyl-tRNA formyltransferase [Patescibacteria group bacterium]